MIPQRNLSLIANGLLPIDGQRIQESVIERDYVLAWFLTGLAGHPLRDALAFKGGTALRRCWFEGYRFSEDLDFTLTKPLPFEEILVGLNQIFAEVETACGLRITFDHKDDGHQNCHTFYLGYQGPLPSPNNVKVDITIKEVLCFPLQDRPVLRTYPGYSDLPEGPTVKVYALEEILVEKLLALSDKARNEPRDLYDLWHLLTDRDLHLGEHRTEIEAKLKFRGRPLTGLYQMIAAKEARLHKLWDTRLSHQVSALPPFDDVFREALRIVRAAGLPE